jgi:hypothetical protein
MDEYTSNGDLDLVGFKSVGIRHHHSSPQQEKGFSNRNYLWEDEMNCKHCDLDTIPAHKSINVDDKGACLYCGKQVTPNLKKTIKIGKALRKLEKERVTAKIVDHGGLWLVINGDEGGGWPIEEDEIPAIAAAATNYMIEHRMNA